MQAIIQANRYSYRKVEKYAGIQVVIQTGRQPHIHTTLQASRQTYRQDGSPRGKHGNRYTGRQPGRQ